MIKKSISFFLLVVPFLVNAQIDDSTKREVKLEGAINFRDIGGYTTKDGKHVKWGKIYRSAALNKLTDADLDKLQTLSITYVADFRGPYEVKVAPDKIPAGATRVSLPAGSENIGDSNYMKNMIKQMANDSSLVNFYRITIPFKDRYKPVFDELLTMNKDSALLFHCTAGKDRTGIGAALILYALGVDEKTIMDDYLATNYYRTAENEKAINAMVKGYGMSESTAKNMMAAKESYLQATFTSIKSQYGSIDNYLEHEMGLDKKKIKKLREMYLN
ncbi:MAG: tyrosine-protein phosphatase [Chitinophagaceae bacterium]